MRSSGIFLHVERQVHTKGRKINHPNFNKHSVDKNGEKKKKYLNTRAK